MLVCVEGDFMLAWEDPANAVVFCLMVRPALTSGCTLSRCQALLDASQFVVNNLQALHRHPSSQADTTLTGKAHCPAGAQAASWCRCRSR